MDFSIKKCLSDPGIKAKGFPEGIAASSVSCLFFLSDGSKCLLMNGHK